MVVQVRVEGAKELARVLRQIGDNDLRKALLAANKTAAAVVGEEARVRAPERSGRLKRSIRPTATQRSGSVKVGGARVPYGNAIHWGRKVGNVGSPPGNRKGPNVVQGNPFITDALADRRAEVIEAYSTEIEMVFHAARRHF